MTQKDKLEVAQHLVKVAEVMALMVRRLPELRERTWIEYLRKQVNL